jgi:glutamate synthase (NADPH/NADH) large chain
MSGGVAYLLDAATHRINPDMVDLQSLSAEDVGALHHVLRRHAEETGSTVAEALLADWPSAHQRFTKVMPRDYQRVLDARARAEREGLDPAEAVMEAARG